MAIRRLQAFVTFLGKNYPGDIATWPREYPPLAGLQWVQDIRLVIGVFCQGGRSYPQLPAILAENGIIPAAVRAFAVRDTELLVSLADGEQVIPLAGKLTARGLPGCAICSDYTALLADIAVNRKSAAPGLTTVITRTDLGRSVLRQMIDNGLLEPGTPEEGAGKIIEQEEKKRRRSAENSGKHRPNLPPSFYTDSSFRVEDSIYDSLLQDFYMVKDIIRNDLCVLCGMCETVCPVQAMKLDGARPVYNNRCSDSICGLCFSTCPQTFVMQGVSQNRFFEEMGLYRQTEPGDIAAVRPAAKQPPDSTAEDNGVLAAIAGYCLREKLVSGFMLLHHWNTKRIRENLPGIDYGLLPAAVRQARGEKKS